MKKHHSKPKYTSTPQKPDLEITSALDQQEEDETIAQSTFEDLHNDVDETSLGNASDNTLTVPMRFPERDKLAVNMVPRDLARQYDEYRSDENTMGAFLFTLIGAFLGVIINWATSDPIVISKTSIIIELILLVVIIFIEIFRVRFGKRAKNIKLEMDDLAKRTSKS